MAVVMRCCCTSSRRRRSIFVPERRRSWHSLRQSAGAWRPLTGGSRKGRKIAEILVSNTFLVKVYADIYADLCLPEFPHCDDFGPLLNDVLTREYMDSLRTVVAVDESDYDAFCDNNKRNDARKARATFFAEASSRPHLLQKERLRDMIMELLDWVCVKMTEEGCTHMVEEIAENIGSLLTNKIDDDQVRQRLLELSQKKPKDFPSWSSRAMFKFMDMLIYI
jgi:hypothetical protein